MTRVRSLCCLALGILLLALLAGCGGGGGGSNLSGAVGRITGTVADLPLDQQSRAPGSSITITVDGTDITTQSGSDGSFVLDRVPIGMHTLVAQTSSRACAVVVGVEENQETNVGEMQLSESGQISGIVTAASDHQPIRGAVVAVTEMVYDSAGEMPHPVRVRRTNAQGSYTVPALPAGEYLVTISKDGFLTSSLDLTVAANATTAGDASLQTDTQAGTGAVSGTVSVQTDSGESRPVSGVLVRLVKHGSPVDTNPLPGDAIDADGNVVDLYPNDGNDAPPPVPQGIAPSGSGVPPVPFMNEYYTFSDENGAYKIDGVPAGQYTAVAVRPGMQADQQSVAITADATATQNFTLTLLHPVFATIEGTVTDANSKNPITGAVVRAIMVPVMPPVPAARGTREADGGGGAVILPDPAHCVMFARTDENGHYTLKAPAQMNGIIVRADGYGPAEKDVQVSAGGSATVDVALTPESSPTQYTLSGKVTMQSSPSGPVSPAAGAVVSATPLASAGGAVPAVVFQATADVNGNYSLDLSGGVYHVSASKGDMQSEVIELTMNENKVRNLLAKPHGGGSEPPPPPPM